MEQTFGEFLAGKRKAQNLTQKQLAKAMFVSESAVCKWEKDIAHPDITMLPTLCVLLKVTEHELITASEDNNLREINKKARRWNNLVSTWDMFFYIAYGLALLTCFIVNLATSKTLDWFFIVLCAVALSASFTTLPKFIKKYKLLVLTTCQFSLLMLLIGTCCLFTNGNWFGIVAICITCLFVAIFLPLYIATYPLPSIVKKLNAIICIIVDYLLILTMCFVIQNFTNGTWLVTLALPLLSYGLLLPILFICLGYIKINKLIKSGVAIIVSTVFSIIGYFITESLLLSSLNIAIDKILFPNFSTWTEPYLSGNVIALIVLASLTTSLALITCGIFRHFRKK